MRVKISPILTFNSTGNENTIVKMTYTVSKLCVVGSSYNFKLNLLSGIKCWVVRSHGHL